MIGRYIMDDDNIYLSAQKFEKRGEILSWQKLQEYLSI